MKFQKTILKNGLSIIGEINKSAKSAAVGFFVKTGARDENADINGVSHFLEHMLFKGTEKLNAFQVNEAFDRTGAQFNAFTSEEMTVFYAAVLPEYLTEITDLWSQLMRPSLRNKDFKMEKNVIKEEIAMYKDLPTFDVMDKCRSLHFENHPCGNSVLGSVESVEKLTSRQMRNYFTKRYAPNNMTLTVVGNFDFKQICELAEEKCGSWKKQSADRILSDYGGTFKKGRETKENLTREHICLISHGVSAQDKKRFAASLLSVIIGDQVGSRFFWELVDKALAETATMQFGAMDATGIFCSYINCSSENREKVLDIVDDIFSKTGTGSISENELQTAKNKILSALVIKNEVPMGRLIDVGFNWMYCCRYQSIQDDIKAIKAVNLDDINSLIDQLQPGKFTQFSLGPAE